MAQLRTAAVQHGRALRALSPTMILLLGFAVFLLYAFPGYMSNDSCDQLGDARGHAFTDAHPPMMAAEWMILDGIVAGPVLMLVVQGGLFLAGLYGLLRGVTAPRSAAVIACLVLLFPPVLTTMAVIWKDSQMAAYLMAGAALLTSPRLGRRLAGLGMISLGIAFRHNAFAAAIPLVWLLFYWRPEHRWWLRYALSSVAAVLTFVAAVTASRALTSHHVGIWDAIALSDIEGMLAYTRDRSDADLRETMRGVPLFEDHDIQANARRTFSPRSSMQLFFADRPMFKHPQPEDHEAIARARLALLRDDWRAYAGYRIATFCELIGLTHEPLWLPVWAQFLGYPELRLFLHHNAAHSRFQQAVLPAMYWMAFGTPMFQPYLYAALALILLALLCRDRTSLALYGSGLGYELGYLLAGTTADFRYSHWMIACVTIATVLVFVRRYRAGRATREAA